MMEYACDFEMAQNWFQLEISITCQNSEIAQNSNHYCIEFNFSSNFEPSQNLDTGLIFRAEIKENLNGSTFESSQNHMHITSCDKSSLMSFWANSYFAYMEIFRFQMLQNRNLLNSNWDQRKIACSTFGDCFQYFKINPFITTCELTQWLKIYDSYFQKFYVLNICATSSNEFGNRPFGNCEHNSVASSFFNIGTIQVFFINYNEILDWRQRNFFLYNKGYII